MPTESPVSTQNNCHGNVNNFYESRHPTNESLRQIKRSINSAYDSFHFTPQIQAEFQSIKGSMIPTSFSSGGIWSDIMDSRSRPLNRLQSMYIDSPANKFDTQRTPLTDQTNMSNSSAYTTPDSVFSTLPKHREVRNDSMDDFLTFESPITGINWPAGDKLTSAQTTIKSEDIYSLSPIQARHHVDNRKQSMNIRSTVHSGQNVNRQEIDFSSINFLDNPPDTAVNEFFDSSPDFTSHTNSSPLAQEAYQTDFFTNTAYFPDSTNSNTHNYLSAQSTPSYYSSTMPIYSPAFTSYNHSEFDFNTPLSNNPTSAALTKATHMHRTSEVSESENDQPANTGGRARNIDREDMDKKLVEWKRDGLTYREIKLRGGWGLEESTLRGRYRTLTKPKEQRLRKPVWTDHAVCYPTLLLWR